MTNYLTGIRLREVPPESSYLSSLPVVRFLNSIEQLNFTKPVTFLVGENGTGKKWDNEYNQGRYWTDEELLGAIDHTGKEVIPCIFDEIKTFRDVKDVFMAHYGGRENGHWGIINKRGKWLVDPIFADIDYEYKDGLFAFYATDKWSVPDNVPLGIYDLKQGRVLIDKDGNVILPCKYDAAWNGIARERRIIIFEKDGKQ